MQVLLVEDSPADAKLAQDLLTEASSGQIKVTQVSRLSTALRLLSRDEYDAMLLDLALLDTHGLDPFSQILAPIARMPIVLLSNPAEEPRAIQALQHGAQDYLVKGQWSADLIARTIEKAITRKRAEEALTYLAQYDYLTALANRTLFRDRLVQALARSKRNGKRVVLMRLGLDRFKAINDTLGHDMGDALLKAAAVQLKSCTREVDTVARLGGDEFTILVEEVPSDGAITEVAQRILNAIAKPFNLSGTEVRVTASIGITIYPLNNHGADELVKHSGTAMDRAKEQGGNRYHFFSALAT